MSTERLKFSYTPPQIADLLDVAHAKVLAWIRSGELKSHNVSTSKHGQRPRYMILHDDLQAFLDSRRVKQPSKPQTRRRRTAGDEMY